MPELSSSIAARTSSASDPTYVLAVDGGASSTRALIASSAGEILAIGRAGPSSLVRGEEGKRRLYKVLHESIHAAVSKLSFAPEHFTSCWLGMTGVRDDREDETVVRSTINSLISCEKVGVSGDMAIALAGASEGHPGVMVYAGTGSAAYGSDPLGNTVKTGGLGSIIDDEGGAFQLGRAALKATFRAADGRGKPTALAEALQAHFEAAGLRAVMSRVYEHNGLDKASLARLARVVGETAAQGDGVARELLAAAAEELSLLATTTVRKLPDPPDAPVIYYAGGVFEAGTPLLSPFEQSIYMDMPKARVSPPAFPPLVGGLFLALEQMDIAITPSLLERIRSTLVTAKEAQPL